jgi:Domain of unknown function (DUF1992)
MHFLDILAEQRIAEAERDGLLKDPPGAGAPLAPRDAYRDRPVERFAGNHSTTGD